VNLRYARAALYADYARAATGIVLCFLPVLFVARNAVTLVLAALGVLFLLFGARTALRHATQVAIDDDGISALGPFGGRIAWERLEQVKLSYYATRRDRKGGWMHMTLTGEGRTLRLDSSLDGFDDVARAAARAAAARHLDVSDATRANFAALDIPFPSAAPEMPA
jgi:hypothetical protein